MHRPLNLLLRLTIFPQCVESPINLFQNSDSGFRRDWGVIYIRTQISPAMQI